MIIPIKRRKTIHLLLFIAILIIQLLIFRIWFNQKKIQNSFSQTIQSLITPNQALIYTNLATKNYFDAENNFNTYLQYHTKSSLNNYRKSMETMSCYLDSLNLLSKRDINFLEVIKNKKIAENDILKLRKQLDSLIHFTAIESGQETINNFAVKKHNYDKVLRSITYDTLRTSTQAKKKGIFGRIGNAIAGKSEVDKEEMQTKIKIIFDDVTKTGTFEEQLKNIFLYSEKHYAFEFYKIKKVYSLLKKKNRFLLNVNKSILSKSQDILMFYSKSAQESIRLQNINAIDLYNLDIKNQKKTILYLLMAMIFATVLLLLYTIYAYVYEDNLEKAKSEAENNLGVKNRLIGMLSHEMRAPLNIISAFSGKLRTRNKNKELDSIINSMHFTSNSLQITVNQILDFFKNENKKLILYNSRTNLKKEIPFVLSSLSSLSEIKKIKIISNLDASLDNEVWTDTVKIHQLFYNLIGNAIKFTKEGSITVNAKLIDGENKFRFDVSIKDTGTGIPKEEIKNIFDKFYQSKTHKDQISFGAGLGLSLCKEIVELFDGEISVKSELNEGTEVSFFLIFDKFVLGQETNKIKLINEFKNKSVKVALVDDDIFTLTIVKKLLSNINFTVVTFETITAIKEYLETEIVDLIITDIHIFDQSGIDFAREIKNSKNKNADCPIIIITGDVFMNSVNYKTINADEILTKPINKDEFYLKIFNVLKS